MTMRNDPATRRSEFAIIAAFLLSGGSGLVYEVAWARALSVMVGGTAVASQAVLAAFFAGTTVGAFLLGRKVAASASGARSYAHLELGIMLAGLMSLVVLRSLGVQVAAFTDGSESPRTALVALSATMLTCFPATFLMGATYPAATRALAQQGRTGDVSRLLGFAYAANTMGAVGGAALTAFVVLPMVGSEGAIGVAAVGNLFAAALAFTGRHISAAPAGVVAAVRPARARALTVAAFATGLVGILLQVTAMRVVAVTLTDTVYTFALAVGAYIMGSAVAAALYGRLAARLSLSPATLFMVAVGFTLVWMSSLRHGAALLRAMWPTERSFGAITTIETLGAVLLVSPIAVPTTWALLALIRARSAHDPSSGAGWGVAWNGVGCAIAPVLSSAVLLPWGGTFAVAATALMVLVLSTLLLAFARPEPPLVRKATLVLVPVVTVGLFAMQDGLFDWYVAEGYRLIWKKEGASVAVAVEESAEGRRRLRTNNNFTEGGDAADIIQVRQGMLPALLKPGAQKALVLGVGSGGTLGGLVSGLPRARVDAVELVPEVRQALSHFADLHRHVHQNPNVSLHIADARTFSAHAARTGRRYDLVVGELFHATQAGVGALYAREHFEHISMLIGETGLYCQWFPMHEAPPAQTKTIIRTFFSVFPHGAVFLGGWSLKTAIIGLVGTARPLDAAEDEIARFIAADGVRALRARQAGLDDLPDLFATYVARADEMRAFAGPGALNSDSSPELELEGPRGVHADMGIINLLQLLPVRRAPVGVIRFTSPGMHARVVALQAATAHFMRGTNAWRLSEFDRAEQELRAAAQMAPTFAPAPRALRDLAQMMARAGATARAAALHDFLRGLPAAPTSAPAD